MNERFYVAKFELIRAYAAPAGLLLQGLHETKIFYRRI